MIDPKSQGNFQGFLFLGNPWECKSRRYDHDLLVPRSLRDLWDMSESHFLPGLHISWLIILRLVWEEPPRTWTVGM